MVNASGTQAALGDFKTTAFAQQNVGNWHAHVFEGHSHMAVGRIVVAKNVQRTNDLKAPVASAGTSTMLCCE